MQQKLVGAWSLKEVVISQLNVQCDSFSLFPHKFFLVLLVGRYVHLLTVTQSCFVYFPQYNRLPIITTYLFFSFLFLSFSQEMNSWVLSSSPFLVSLFFIFFFFIKIPLSLCDEDMYESCSNMFNCGKLSNIGQIGRAHV